MGQVPIRNLDDETTAAYREAVARHGRSLDAEWREVLRRFRPTTDARRREAQERMATIRAMTPTVPQTPSEIPVREDRDGHRDA